MKRAINFVAILACFTAIGSIYRLVYVPYVVLACVFIVTILIVLNRIDKRYYPIYIFGLALSLIWQTTMIGTYIVGADIHSEYYVATQVIQNGWDRTWDNVGNTSIILTFITPLLSHVIDPIWQFKALFPLVCSFTPVVLYLAFKDKLGETSTYLIVLFLIIMPMFTMEVAGIVKSQWAYLFIASIVYCLFKDVKYKTLWIGLFVILTLLSHYTVGIITVFYLVGILILLCLFKIKKGWFNKSLSVRALAVVFVGVFVMFISWFSFVGEGFMLKQIKNIYRSVTTGISISLNNNTDRSIYQEVVIPENTSVSELPKQTYEKLVENYVVEQAKPIKDDTYLDKQPSLIRSAIGLDFSYVSGMGKVFRVVQYITEIMIVVGFIFFIMKRKQYGFSNEYIASVVCSVVLLGCSIFVPYFTLMTVNTTRLYMITLLFIAPLFIIGVENICRLIKVQR